ncbi:MAG: metal ABC transporter permease [Candidatus Pacebacteria bacterium]|nr:metal ABC transporter permease [Candidatus Paceibacterota bacterium]NUQ57011.1 metal ABC transporter permease [Candidatus Paceibacter sp.]
MSIDFLSLITAVFIGGAAGYIGSLMATRKMVLAGDVLSHVALPGVGLAFLYGINMSLGALASLLIGTIVIWALEIKTKLAVETLVGVVFVLSLAVGYLITPDEELIHALFGDISRISAADAVSAVVVAILVFFLIRKIYPKLMLAYVSEDLALAGKVKIWKYNLIYLLSIALIIAFGVKVAGTLLTSALIILPAAASRNFSRSMFQYSYAAMIAGAVTAGSGVALAGIFGWPVGPVIILVNALIFGWSLLLKK